MSRKVRLINGKGDWTDVPPTGASDADLYQLANDFVAQPGVVDKEGGDGKVTESDTPGLSVKIQKGTFYVLNSSWEANSFEPKYYQVVVDADEDLAISSNSSGDTRFDLVCLKIDKITVPNDDASNVCPYVKVEGTPGDPAPALPDDYLLLGTLEIPDGTTTEILDAMIEDGREQVYLDSKSFVVGGFKNLVDSGTITIDLSVPQRLFRVTLGGNRVIAITNPKEGDKIYARFTNDGTARTPVWPANVTWFGIEDDPDMSDYVDANKTGAFLFICTDEDVPRYDGFFLGAEE